MEPAGPGWTVKAVRAAIQVRENAPEPIRRASVRLIQEVLRRNAIAEEQIVSAVFSLTRDLDQANPATAVRDTGFRRTPLMCLQEAFIQGQMPRVIRLLLTYRTSADRIPQPVYLDGAENLRPDLAP